MENTAHAHPITSPKVYAGVLAALLVLTVITVTAAGIDFGPYNTVIALIIATIKASLVAIFLIFTLFDINSRQTILPSNLKEPVKEFPGAPLNKPVRPSTGSAVVTEPAK